MACRARARALDVERCPRDLTEPPPPPSAAVSSPRSVSSASAPARSHPCPAGLDQRRLDGGAVRQLRAARCCAASRAVDRRQRPSPQLEPRARRSGPSAIARRRRRRGPPASPPLARASKAGPPQLRASRASTAVAFVVAECTVGKVTPRSSSRPRPPPQVVVEPPPSPRRLGPPRGRRALAAAARAECHHRSRSYERRRRHRRRRTRRRARRPSPGAARRRPADQTGRDSAAAVAVATGLRGVEVERGRIKRELSVTGSATAVDGENDHRG